MHYDCYDGVWKQGNWVEFEETETKVQKLGDSCCCRVWEGHGKVRIERALVRWNLTSWVVYIEAWRDFGNGKEKERMGTGNGSRGQYPTYS